MRIVFCGTPDFAVPSLRRLAREPGVTLDAVITQPDRPSGRGQQLGPSAVKRAASEAGLRIEQPEKIKSETVQQLLTSLVPDAVVIIAYGQIVPARLLAIPRLGWINVHASLLPRYRGAAPIHWAIANGESLTGLTTMHIDAGMDTGPILLQRELAIAPDETAPELSARMSELGAELIGETLLRLDRGEISPRPQDNAAASYAPLLKKEDGRIDWSRSAAQIYNRMRGFMPWPGAFSTFRGHTCNVWGRPSVEPSPAQKSAPGQIILAAQDVYAACAPSTFLRLESVQIEGRKRVSAREFANGARLLPDDRFLS